jgi:GMP synthase-like glutamine amidotransferase
MHLQQSADTDTGPDQNMGSSSPSTTTPSNPIRLAILECDTPLPNTQAKYDSYGGVFTTLLHRACTSLKLSPATTLAITCHDVVNSSPLDSAYPSFESIDAILITGSRYNSFDNTPWILALVQYVKTALLEHPRIKVIGVCFGHQIVGRALGAEVGRAPAGWELAVTQVSLTPLGRTLFSPPDGPATESISIHQMHRDIVFALPPQSPSSPAAALPKIEPLGFTEKCQVQGMYIPHRLITVQGHPEFNAEIVEEILRSRHGMGIFDDATFGAAMGRVGREQDGVRVAEGFVRFLTK